MADLLAQAEQQYRAAAYAEAASILERLVAESAADPRAVYMLGMCRLRTGDPAAALPSLEEAHRRAPADAHIRLGYGIGLQAVGRHREAAEHFTACRSLLPEDPAPFLNLASARLALGEAAAALDAARRARRRAPEMPQAHYTEGQALLALRRLGEAAEAFSKCLQRAPDFADAWVNLGVARYRAGNIEGAKQAMRQALAVAPGHPAAAANLGAFLRLTGEGQAQEGLLQELVASNPEATAARLNLVAELLQEERSSEALALLDERFMPEDLDLLRHWRLQQSLALLQSGRAQEARVTLEAIGEVPASLRALYLWRQVLLALSEGDAAGARNYANEMAAALEPDAAMLPEHQIMAHFDLARFWSQQGEGTLAFPHWTAGHRLLGRMQPFSREASRAFFDANITNFSRERLRDGARAQNRDPAPVFIVGMPRSGTTLTEQIIAAHPQAFGAGERDALAQAWQALGGSDEAAAVARLAALDGPALDAAASAFLETLHALAPGAARVVDKMPGNFNYLGLVARMLPGARIIHCSRDPRDIGLSIFTFRFYGYHPYAHDLGDLGWYIAQHERLMRHWHAVLLNPILTVRLRDWVDDFTGTLRCVLEFLDLPYDPICERFYEQDRRVRTVSRAQVRQPVNPRGLDRWRPFEAELQPLIAELRAGGVAL